MASCCKCTICNNSDDSSNAKVSVCLEFSAVELIDDINNYAWVEGEVLGEDNQHAQHVLVEVGEEGNIERIYRILSLVNAEAIEALYPYTKQDVVEEHVGDELWEPSSFFICMKVSSTFSRTTIHLLSRLIHEWMVYRALAMWLSITNPEAAGKWDEKAEEIKEKIDEAKNRRGKAFTRPMNPW